MHKGWRGGSRFLSMSLVFRLAMDENSGYRRAFHIAGAKWIGVRGDKGSMRIPPMLRAVLDDASLTRGLGDSEARCLIEWLVNRVDQNPHWSQFQKLHRLARIVGRFIALWNAPQSRGAAYQLVASERILWPLPNESEEPLYVLEKILQWIDLLGLPAER